MNIGLVIIIFLLGLTLGFLIGVLITIDAYSE